MQNKQTKFAQVTWWLGSRQPDNPDKVSGGGGAALHDIDLFLGFN